MMLKEQGLKVCENRVLRIHAHKREEKGPSENGECFIICTLHQTLLETGEMRNAFRIFVGKPEGKRRLGSPSRRYEDNIRMDLREIGLEVTDWMHLAQVGTSVGLL
jgi:hypothetical protein